MSAAINRPPIVAKIPILKAQIANVRRLLGRADRVTLLVFTSGTPPDSFNMAAEERERPFESLRSNGVSMW